MTPAPYHDVEWRNWMTKMSKKALLAVDAKGLTPFFFCLC
jgi:hypothetical protein